MKRFLISCVVLAFASAPLTLPAQITGYSRTILVGNAPGVGNKTDAHLSNPWGIAFIPGAPFWIADNNSGVSTIYDAQGNTVLAPVGIPVAANNPCSPGCPTGIVANNTIYFGGSFVFDTEDGILASWNGAANAVKAFDNSASGAVYKGLAMVTNGSGNFLLAANFRTGQIDVFDRNLQLTRLAGPFTPTNLPAGFAPHGVHVIGSSVYVAYAMQDAAKHDASPGAGLGVIAIFDLNGNFMQTFAAGGPLNAPWGVAMAPATFGPFANDLLVGNFGDGTINAFDPASRAFKGQLSDTSGAPIVNAGLWDMVFGQGGTGDPNTLYITAGGANQTQGVFAALTPSQAATTADFSLMLSAPTVQVMRGGSAMVTVQASAVGGFNSPISLSCAGVQAGVNCSATPSTITPGSSTASSTITVSLAPTYGMAKLAWPTLWTGVLGFTAVGFSRNRLAGLTRRRLLLIGLLIATATLLVVTGCAGTSRGMGSTGNSANVTITGTSGAISHSTTLAVMVN